MLLQRVVVVLVVLVTVVLVVSVVVEVEGTPPQPLPQHSVSAPRSRYPDGHRGYSGVIPAEDLLQVTHTKPCHGHNQRGLFHKFAFKTSTEAVTVSETVTKFFTCTAAYPDHLKYCRGHRTLPLLHLTPLPRTLAPLHSVTEDMLVTLLSPYHGTLLGTQPGTHTTHPGTHTTHPGPPKHDRVLPHPPKLMPEGTSDTLLVDSITPQRHGGEVRPECEPTTHEAITEALFKPQSKEQGFDTHVAGHLKTLPQPNAASRVPQYDRVPSVDRCRDPRFLANVEYIKLVTSTVTSTSTFTDYHHTVSLIYRGCIPEDAPKVPKCPPPDKKNDKTHGAYQHTHSQIPCMGACFGQCQGACDGVCIGHCVDPPAGRAEVSANNCTEGAESCLSVPEKERVVREAEDETKMDRKKREAEDDTKERRERDTMDETKDRKAKDTVGERRKDREGRDTQVDEAKMGRSGVECLGDCFGFCDGTCNGKCDSFCSNT